MRKQAVIFTLAYVAVFLLVTSSSASSTQTQHMINAGWDSNPTVRADTGMPAPFNSATARAEMKNGRLAWNNVAGAVRDIASGSDLAIADGATISNVTIGQMWMTDSALSGAVARTNLNTGGPLFLDIQASLTETDVNNVSWHVSSLTTQNIGTQDLRSVSTHELGHGMGFKGGADHVNVNCATRSTANTMCASHIAAFAGSQSTYYRSLQSHEVSDFVSKYD